jgi:aspartyl-tRNA(Asn)/glutamyl-tRNA(Gln) amidotransferase subunit A
MSELLELTLVELTRTLHGRRASPVELMDAVLRRIDLTHERLNAVVAMRSADALLADARAAEARIAAGDARPLEGIPFCVKDLEDAQGLTTSHGSVPFRDQVAIRDSVQVARLKRAGAIVVGKTNSPEFGHTAVTKNLLYGVTRSPWDKERTPGGSSGGAAAVLSGEVVPLVTASDGGGSIRIPASFVGAFGLKTSHGRIPNGPRDRWSQVMTIVQGPLTKTVADAALVLDQVVGHDECDPASLPHPGASYADGLAATVPSRLRIAFAPDFGRVVVQADVALVVEEAARVFEKLGHELTLVREGPPDLLVEWGLTNALEIAGAIGEFLPDRESEFMQSLMAAVRMSDAMTPRWLNEAARKRASLVNYLAELFSRFDLLLTPTVPYDPPPAKGPFPAELEGRSLPTGSVASFCIPFNLSWHPAATVRAGLSRAGLPVGLQIVAPHHREDLLLAAAHAFERERPWHPHWPMR